MAAHTLNKCETAVKCVPRHPTDLSVNAEARGEGGREDYFVYRTLRQRERFANTLERRLRSAKQL